MWYALVIQESRLIRLARYDLPVPKVAMRCDNQGTLHIRIQEITAPDGLQQDGQHFIFAELSVVAWALHRQWCYMSVQ